MTAPALLATPNTVFPLALYDTMCRAIAEAHEVDEVKDIRDKALAFEVYARQAQNTEAEQYACEIRLRAERKAGALIQVMDKAKAGRPPANNPSPAARDFRGAPTLGDLGISYDQSSQWQQLADIPDDQFEAALTASDRKPSTAGIIAAATPPKPDIVPVASDALWLWGRLRDFERDGLLAKTIAEVLLTLPPRMLDDVHTLAPRVASWLAQIGRTDQ